MHRYVDYGKMVAKFNLDVAFRISVETGPHRNPDMNSNNIIITQIAFLHFCVLTFVFVLAKPFDE